MLCSHISNKPHIYIIIINQHFTFFVYLFQFIQGERPYKCHLPDCGRAFIQLSNLQQHLRNHDAQVERAKNRPFHCNICGKGFATESSLRTHTSKVSNVDNNGVYMHINIFLRYFINILLFTYSITFRNQQNVKFRQKSQVRDFQLKTCEIKESLHCILFGLKSLWPDRQIALQTKNVLSQSTNLN